MNAVKERVMAEVRENDRKAEAAYDPVVRAVSVEVYKLQLGEQATASMLAKDGDGGKKLTGRAASYDTLSRSYMRVLKHPHIIALDKKLAARNAAQRKEPA
jgi:hypothetical protein